MSQTSCRRSRYPATRSYLIETTTNSGMSAGSFCRSPSMVTMTSPRALASQPASPGSVRSSGQSHQAYPRVLRRGDRTRATVLSRLPSSTRTSSQSCSGQEPPAPPEPAVLPILFVVQRHDQGGAAFQVVVTGRLDESAPRNRHPRTSSREEIDRTGLGTPILPADTAWGL